MLICHNLKCASGKEKMPHAIFVAQIQNVVLKLQWLSLMHHHFCLQLAHMCANWKFQWVISRNFVHKNCAVNQLSVTGTKQEKLSSQNASFSWFSFFWWVWATGWVLSTFLQKSQPHVPSCVMCSSAPVQEGVRFCWGLIVTQNDTSSLPLVISSLALFRLCLCETTDKQQRDFHGSSHQANAADCGAGWKTHCGKLRFGTQLGSANWTCTEMREQWWGERPWSRLPVNVLWALKLEQWVRLLCIAQKPESCSWMLLAPPCQSRRIAPITSLQFCVCAISSQQFCLAFGIQQGTRVPALLSQLLFFTCPMPPAGVCCGWRKTLPPWRLTNGWACISPVSIPCGKLVSITNEKGNWSSILWLGATRNEHFWLPLWLWLQTHLLIHGMANESNKMLTQMKCECIHLSQEKTMFAVHSTQKEIMFLDQTICNWKSRFACPAQKCEMVVHCQCPLHWLKPHWMENHPGHKMPGKKCICLCF